LEVVDPSKIVASHVGFAEIDSFGVCFDYAARYHYGNTFACNVLYAAKAIVVATRWLALLSIDRFGDIRRGKSNFDVSNGDPHGGGGSCSSGDHGDRITMVIMF
jgi:hypothetical protein